MQYVKKLATLTPYAAPGPHTFPPGTNGSSKADQGLFKGLTNSLEEEQFNFSNTTLSRRKDLPYTLSEPAPSRA